MAQGFHRRRGVAKSIRQIAGAEIDAAVASIRDPQKDDAETVHDVRLQLKRLRALLRLPAEHFPDYSLENIAFRDLGQRLAHIRDADVLQQTAESLAAEADIGDLATLRAEIAATVTAPDQDVRALLQGEITAGLLEAKRRVQGWRFDRKGFALLADGLQNVYQRMRAGEALALRHPSAANFHEWRKQAKYHANQLALLKPAAPDVLKNYRTIGDKLASTLGGHHDLDVLREAAKAISPAQSAPLLEAISARNAKLEVKAFRLGDELTAERPADFLRRIEASWQAWRC
ncbi:MAG TPA: CHAD domain-containing protein [Devosiaceae bacterium]|nr:CHAD domain-containing protein [Devosiaceae bacterium]